MNRLNQWWTRARRSAVLYGFIGTGIRMASQLLLLPIILDTRVLSTSELALWWVFIALGNLANLADFGFGQVISRVYSYLWAGAEDFDSEGLRPPPTNQAPNIEGTRRLNRAVRFIYLRISAGATIILGIAGTAFLFRLIHGNEHSSLQWVAWFVFLLITGYGIGTSHWVLACQGINLVRAAQISNIWASVAYLICAFTFLHLKLGILAMVLATGVRHLIARSICRNAFVRCVPFQKDTALDLKLVTKLWPNAWKFGVLSIGGYLLNNGTVLVCSQFLSKETTASWGLTIQVGMFLSGFATLWLMVKWPEIAMLRTQGKLQEMSELFARRLAIVMATFVLGAIALYLMGNRILEWKGTHTRFLPAAYFAVYLLYLGQQIFYGQFGNLILTENVIPFFKIGLWTGIGMFLLSMIMTPLFGLWGLVLAPWITESACACWYTIRRGLQGQPLPPMQLVRIALFGHNLTPNRQRATG